MQNVLEWMRLAIAAIGGVLAWFFGPWDALIAVLAAFVAVDYVMGVIGAAMRKELSSEVGFKGLLKKIVVFLMVGVATMLDLVVPAADGVLRSAMCMFFIANEGLSILENAGNMGIPLPDKLKEMLEQIKNTGDKDSSKTE